MLYSTIKNPRAVQPAEGAAPQRSIVENADMRYDSTVLKPHTQDLTQQPFGAWRVVAFAGYKGKHKYWTCQCICGTIRDVLSFALIAAKSTSCGCVGHARRAKARIQDLTGQSFGAWTVQSYAGTVAGSTLWTCICLCGHKRQVRRSELLRATSQS